MDQERHFRQFEEIVVSAVDRHRRRYIQVTVPME